MIIKVCRVDQYRERGIFALERVDGVLYWVKRFDMPEVDPSLPKIYKPYGSLQTLDDKTVIEFHPSDIEGIIR